MKNIKYLLLFSLISLFSHSAFAEPNRAGNPRGYQPDALLDVFKLTQADSDIPFKSLMQACPARDCIPSIDKPEFVAVKFVDYMQDNDLLLILTHNGITRAYPTRILDHHEIVNDWIGQDPIAVTYCPLCGSGLAFDRRLDGQVLEFGVSSLLHNSDLVMYDRRAESLWQQITGEAFAGKYRGRQLKSLPLAMVEWGSWFPENPDARVLTVDDVKTDRYQKVAYGDYAQSKHLYMPVSATDARLHPKRVIYALEIGDQALAIDARWLAKEKHWSNVIDKQKLVVDFGVDGVVSASLDDHLLPITRMYWFAWYSFHPDTALINGDTQ